MAKKIYAAGFDLFAPNGAERCKQIYDLCLQYGFEPYVPGYRPGAEVDTGSDNKPLSQQEIFELNIGHLNNCDILMANVNPYRGYEPDSGTAYEIGYAFAKGLPVYMYRQDMRSMAQILGGTTDKDGFRVEDFDSPLNLMLACSGKTIQGEVEDCLKAMLADGVNK